MQNEDIRHLIWMTLQILSLSSEKLICKSNDITQRGDVGVGTINCTHNYIYEQGNFIDPRRIETDGPIQLFCGEYIGERPEPAVVAIH